MIKNSLEIKNYHKRFIQEIVKTETVWGLQSEEGWATSSANNYDDENGEPEKLICFWSDVTRARVCQKKYWPDYKPNEIPLTSFMENWLTGMDQDGSIVGTNFDWNLFGFEALPFNLLIELFDTLKAKEHTLNFQKYDSHDEFEKLARETLKHYKSLNEA